MSFSKSSTLYFTLILFSSFQIHVSSLKQSYIVYLGGHSHNPQVSKVDLDIVTHSHHQFLASSLGGSVDKAKESIFYSYKRHINGFAATLDDEEAATIARHPSVISVFLNKGHKLHTTHSWDFMSLENKGKIPSHSLWKMAKFGENIIIANLDTGVWPESKSFGDRGYGPIPSRWKGGCVNSTIGVPCNKKLIGAKFFNRGYAAAGGDISNLTNNSPRDFKGHGSHTLSTAAGNTVTRTRLIGLPSGTAHGGSPRARAASYKVCWSPIDDAECFDADILAGFDEAIHDGVDVISVSLGGESNGYFNDGISIGSFHATRRGIVVVCSAGNSGPKVGSVSNVSPWVFTVGASTMDREFRTVVVLKNGIKLKGQSLSKPLSGKKKFYPLITGMQAKLDSADENDALLCKPQTLNPAKVKGKIVVCIRGVTARVAKGREAYQAGAVGMILANDMLTGDELTADAHFLPASQITYIDGLTLSSYINSTRNPEALIDPPEAKLGVKSSPYMASFSSQGPNTLTPQILKPDITAPGVNVIAAYSGAVSPTDEPYDMRRVSYYVQSGTSMSCPHISGIAGLLKALYPHWSPAAIRSAIMTTAYVKDNTGGPILNGSLAVATPFDYGSGHVNPNRAANPGLVYDLETENYLHFLCSIGYNKTEIGVFTGTSDYMCQKHTAASADKALRNFNYPSIAVPNLPKTSPVMLTRRVKNVGGPGVYVARIGEPNGVQVSVKPKVLKFEKMGEEKEFKVTLRARKNGVEIKNNEYVFGHLVWSDGKRHIRSPIVVAAAA